MKNFLGISILTILILTINSCKKDACDSFVCLNGAHCANGACVCPQGYSGADCSQQLTPTSITITKIEITRFPATASGGGGWDPLSGPEIFPICSLGTSSIWSSPTYYSDATQGSYYSFTPSPSIQLSNPSSLYTVALYDYDSTDPNDWMGGISFYPYSSALGFPATRTIDAGGDVAFKLYLTYTW